MRSLLGVLKHQSGFGWGPITPNAHRCLRSARVHLWHAWQCIKSAVRHQLKGF